MIDLDTESINHAWSNARDAALTILRAKAAAPFEPTTLSEDAIQLVRHYESYCAKVRNLSLDLQKINNQIVKIKNKAPELTSPLLKLMKQD